MTVETQVNVVMVEAPVTTVVVSDVSENAIDLETTIDEATVSVTTGGAQGTQGIQGVPGSGTFGRGGTFVNPTGVEAGDLLVWRCPFDCVVTGFYGWADDEVVVNALRNDDPLLVADLDVTVPATWTPGGTLQNTAFTDGDSLSLQVVSVPGNVTEVSIQVDFLKP